MRESIIRPARVEDIDALCALYHEFHEYYVKAIPERLISLGDLEEIDQSERVQALQEIMEGYDSAIFVAESEGQCVGIAEVYLRKDEPCPRKRAHRFGYLQSLMITESYRGCGLGARLLQESEEWALRKGAEEMRLETWEFDDRLLDFYTGHGFKTLRRTLVRKLLNDRLSET